MKFIKKVWNSEWKWRYLIPFYVVLFFIGFGLGTLLASL